MKILLITGQSATGKSTIVKHLLNEYDGYSNIQSYTDRAPRQEENKYSDHIFVERETILKMIKTKEVAATTKINSHRYASFVWQFKDDKVNVYIVDTQGINDIIDTFPYADIMTVLVRRNDVEADNFRLGRNILVPSRDDVDFVLDNNGPIETTKTLAGVINVLVKNDFFKKPRHTIRTLEESIEHCDKMCQYIDSIRKTLEIQRWYRDKPIFMDFVDYLKLNIDEFDFDIRLETHPFYDADDEYCAFYIQLCPKDDLDWEQSNRLLELATTCSINYSHEKDVGDVMLRLSIYIGDKEEIL